MLIPFLLLNLTSSSPIPLIAERNNVKFKFNSYFPIRSLNLMRGVLVAEEDNIKNYYIDNILNLDKVFFDSLIPELLPLW